MKRILLLILFMLNMAMTFAQKVYRGTSSYQSDILFTYRDNKVYRKNESYQSSILLNSSAPLHPIILYILLYNL